MIKLLNKKIVELKKEKFTAGKIKKKETGLPYFFEKIINMD